MKTQLQLKISELWHISRTAMAGQDTSRHSRMIYVKNALKKHSPSLVNGMSNKAIWLEIEDQLSY